MRSKEKATQIFDSKMHAQNMYFRWFWSTVGFITFRKTSWRSGCIDRYRLGESTMCNVCVFFRNSQCCKFAWDPFVGTYAQGTNERLLCIHNQLNHCQWQFGVPDRKESILCNFYQRKNCKCRMGYGLRTMAAIGCVCLFIAREGMKQRVNEIDMVRLRRFYSNVQCCEKKTLSFCYLHSTVFFSSSLSLSHFFSQCIRYV